jgi:hypothetical protein
VLQNSCDTEVSDFDSAVLVHENVLSFEITMQNLPVMNMFDRKGHLHKPVEDLVLAVLDLTEFLLVGDFCVEVSAICIVHDDAEAPLIHKRLFVSDNIRMSHGLQHMYFIYCVFSLLPIHFRNVDDLHHVFLAVLNRLHKNCKAKGTLADDL